MVEEELTESEVTYTVQTDWHKLLSPYLVLILCSISSLVALSSWQVLQEQGSSQLKLLKYILLEWRFYPLTAPPSTASAECYANIT